MRRWRAASSRRVKLRACGRASGSSWAPPPPAGSSSSSPWRAHGAPAPYRRVRHSARPRQRDAALVRAAGCRAHAYAVSRPARPVVRHGRPELGAAGHDHPVRGRGAGDVARLVHWTRCHALRGVGDVRAGLAVSPGVQRGTCSGRGGDGAMSRVAGGVRGQRSTAAPAVPVTVGLAYPAAYGHGYADAGPRLKLTSASRRALRCYPAAGWVVPLQRDTLVPGTPAAL